MCGIFGIIARENSNIPSDHFQKIVNLLFRRSESRGKEASGLALNTDDAIRVLKRDVAASTFIKMPEYANLFSRTFKKKGLGSNKQPLVKPIAVIGHSRLVTTGGQEIHDNNQPVIKQGLVGIHNGIIVNTLELWKRFPDIRQEYDVDSEVIFALIRKLYDKNRSLTQSAAEVFNLIAGTASIAAFFEDLDCVLLATNNGSLYFFGGSDQKSIVFASEHYILSRLMKERSIAPFWKDCHIRRIKPGQGYLIDLKNPEMTGFSLDGRPVKTQEISKRAGVRKIVDIPPPQMADSDKKRALTRVSRHDFSQIEREFPYNESLFNSIKRCTKCLMPYTMPYITFDKEGVCNFCRNYVSHPRKGKDSLFELSNKLRSANSDIDCLVGLSGGRDSTYALHYVKNVLKLNPAAYTYDWGMVTDLARRNISRICGKLGVEHIIVSADINKKRRYIKKNVKAWLRRPELGIIPLFMAGDKHYFFYAEKVKKQLGVKLIIFGENLLERADKAAFSWVRPADIDKDHAYTISFMNKLRMLAFYGKNYLMNPAYFNESVVDTLVGYACYYIINKRNYLNIYRYIKWDEDKVVSTIIDEYDWEGATDTESTWRVGDGTASFYNYIYYSIAGFTENDAMRSNQIREGMISREEALKLVREENRPRFESIKWYLDTIKLDMDMADVLRIIHSAPKLYTGSP